MLDLDDYVVIKLAIEWMEIFICGLCAISLHVSPIKMVVVDKSSVEDDAVVRLESAGDHVRRIGRCATVSRGSEASLGIGLHDESAKVRNQTVDLINFAAPPSLYSRVDRIKSVQTSDHLWTAEVHRQRERHTPRTKCIRNARELRKEFGSEHS